MQEFDVIIIGAGASGLMCAATAGYQGKSVLVLDHAPKAGAKIRISGGGKCNFTNTKVVANNYICQNPHFVKSALARFTPQDFIDLVERHGLIYEERELGKLFCLNKASDLIQILRTECDWAKVTFQFKTFIQSIKARKNNAGFCVMTEQGALQCKSLVIATGGLSFPKLKASSFGYEIASQFELKILPNLPGLVNLIFDNKWLDFCYGLSGISLAVKVCIQEKTFQESMLFTHKGISGPAILQASNYWRKGNPLTINLLPKLDVLTELQRLKSQNKPLQKWLLFFWPKKFVKAWINLYPFEDLANQSNESIESYAHQLTHWQLYPSDTAGYDKAEVTLGGVGTNEISSKTFESHKQPNLYFIGEVLDVTGQLGGYNFQWAWASGVACGLAVKCFLKELDSHEVVE